ncbi:uncharacterized protein LOC133302650 [Gastrolobium bilobum]|uniref:uncharacterized protein LOC133302650 n=1 Tax=Gastrolobium bilobum TaxID=150636 RepID=UPI002AB13EA7|nr:uncharacterized protein LOC133302650 [Gastrolobium bilobum]
MAKHEKSKPGCFSGFLHVLLCAGNGTSPPVHPSDNVTELDETEVLHSNKDAIVDDNVATPGLVARLMGLDSLPNNKRVLKGATPDSVPRSRSVNFVDYLLEFDLGQTNHRRVKTSASFREVPSLVQRQKSDLSVLYYDDNACKDQEARTNLRKWEMGLGELKQRKKQGSKNKEIVRERVSMKKERDQGKNKKISKLKNEPRRVPSSKHGSKVRNHGEGKDLSNVSTNSKSCNCSYRYSSAASSSSSSSSLLNRHKKGFVEPKIRNNIRNQRSPKKIETESSSENLSPVSVLDINDYPFLYGTDFLDGTSGEVSKSKHKSSLLQYLGDGVEEKADNNKGYASYTDANREAEIYSELMLKLRTLTEKDIRESDCTPNQMFSNSNLGGFGLAIRSFWFLVNKTIPLS